MRFSFFILSLTIGANILGYIAYSQTFGENSLRWVELAEAAIRWEVIAFFVSFWLSLTFGRQNRFAKAVWVFIMLNYVPMFILTFAIIYGSMPIAFDPEGLPTSFLADSDRLYFSVVTFTTLGYGDIQPPQDFRLLASFQALLGFLFVPIIIAEITNFVYSFQKPQAGTSKQS